MTKYLYLLVAGSIVMGGVQLLIAATRHIDNQADTHDPQAVASPAPATPAMVPAAVASGEFEPPYQPTPTSAPAPTPSPEPLLAPAPAVFQSGIASTYGVGDGFQGQRTACGQIFDAHVVQLAHKSLPCGTRVRVEDASTGRSVEARVTDRGPYVAGRVADLSWAAFQQIHPSGPGLVRVNLYVLDG